ncbi:hypothetical protein N5J66_00775 [Pseudomonas juntendi]|uniref:hypothetical protein n=1 Tax=Pseudomonas juntendi TaxID=2666183 RepID=UPI00244C9ACE|nr:hypothetical protein [Pseudomonas juntendi]MDH2012510.1 hypothetical protein [Pseudomonas juntendi]
MTSESKSICIALATVLGMADGETLTILEVESGARRLTMFYLLCDGALGTFLKRHQPMGQPVTGD